MVTCASCGHDVSGKKFCPECGTPVQPQTAQAVAVSSCPRCHGEVKSGAAFCMHCGVALNAAVQSATTFCPACHQQVSSASAFCTNCGQDMHARVASPAAIQCAQCGYQNVAGVRFCSGCGRQLVGNVPSTPEYGPSGQYPQYVQNPQMPVSPYQQGQYQQNAQLYAPPQYGQVYGQPQYGQNAYQGQPMVGQAPMVLRCPTCMAQASLGTANCVSCRTSLMGIVPTPANMPVQGQQGGFLQGNGGKFAMGALGGVVATLGAEALLHGAENSIENRVEGDMGFGRPHHHRNEGLLGGLGELVDDIGL